MYDAVGRFGGDGCAVHLPEIPDADAARAVAERIRDAIAGTQKIRRHPQCPETASNVGIPVPLNNLVTGDTSQLRTWSWCRCKVGPRAATVRIERWTGDDGLIASGWAHATTSCRRLISMD